MSRALVFSRKPYGQIGRENLATGENMNSNTFQKRIGILDFVRPIRIASTSKPNRRR